MSALSSLASPAVCSLVPPPIAQAAVGKAIAAQPTGVKSDGLGTNCIWYPADPSQPGYVKVEFNRLSWEQSAALAKGNGATHEATVSGRPALAYANADRTQHLLVQLGAPDQPGVDVEAPKPNGATAVAEAVIAALLTR